MGACDKYSLTKSRASSRQLRIIALLSNPGVEGEFKILTYQLYAAILNFACVLVLGKITYYSRLPLINREISIWSPGCVIIVPFLDSATASGYSQSGQRGDIAPICVAVITIFQGGL